MSDADFTGRFLWHELVTTDPEAAAAFYGGVVGWEASRWEGAEPPYWVLGEAEGQAAGLMELPEDARARGAPPHWMGYVGCPDVDATTAKAVERGASQLVPPMEMPEVGRFSVLQDPQGAMIAFYTPANEPPPGALERPGVGRFSWHELATTDLDGAWEFYQGLFGWDETGSFDMGEMGTYRIFGAGGVELGGIFQKPAAQPGPPSWLYYARVADLDGAVAAVSQGGGEVMSGPMEVPGGDRVAQCVDPQGAFFALHEVTAGEGG